MNIPLAKVSKLMQDKGKLLVREVSELVAAVSE